MGCSTSRQQTTFYCKDEGIESLPKESGPYINSHLDSYEIIEKEYEHKTYYEELLQAFQKFKDTKCLGYRKHIQNEEFENVYTYLNYQNVWDYANILARNLKHHGLVENQFFEDEGEFKFLGVFSKNCVECTITDIANNIDSVTNFFMYSTLGEEAFDFIFKQTKLRTVCISPDLLKRFFDLRKIYKFPTLKNVIIFDMTNPITAEQKDLLFNSDINSYYFSQLIKEEKSTKGVELTPPVADTVMTLSYTSGTTGVPKGVMLTQRNFIAQLRNHHDSGMKFTSDDSYFSYLPTAHVFDRVITLAMISIGGSTGYITGDVRKYLLIDLPLFKPTLLCAVPKVLQNIRNNIMDKFSKLEGIKAKLINRALEVKRKALREENKISDSFYDFAVFRNVRNAFGGRVRLFVTGSAPLLKEVADDIKVLFSVPIIEAYGMTELCGASHVTVMDDFRNNSVGGPLSTCKVKLVDVPEMNYHSNTTMDKEHSPSGEVCVKGPICFKGYFSNHVATRETIDEEGWVHTGDIGRLLPGSKGLKIVDRLKQIFKLSQGEYIAPAKLEAVYGKSPYVQVMCVYGNSAQNHLLAIIQPNNDKIFEFLKHKGKIPLDSKLENVKILDFYEDSDLIDEIKKDLHALAASAKFNGLEKPHGIILSKIEFTPGNGLFTPTMKLVRKKVEEIFKTEIDKAYGLR